MSEFVLCYIDAPWAYFTTQPLEDQWGDDWDDAPYEHNAGAPYDPPRPDLPAEERANLFPHAWLPDGTPRWRIKRVAFDGDFITPSYEYLNSPWSVQRINRGEIAWLRPAPWSDHAVVIYAGTTLSDFIGAVQRAGGRVYVESVEIARLTRELEAARERTRHCERQRDAAEAEVQRLRAALRAVRECANLATAKRIVGEALYTTSEGDSRMDLETRRGLAAEERHSLAADTEVSDGE